MLKTDSKNQVRLPPDLLRRAAVLAIQGTTLAGAEVTQMAVVREALERGLVQMEGESLWGSHNANGRGS